MSAQLCGDRIIASFNHRHFRYPLLWRSISRRHLHSHSLKSATRHQKHTHTHTQIHHNHSHHQHIVWRTSFCTHAQSKQPQQNDETGDDEAYEDSSEYEYEYEYESDEEFEDAKHDDNVKSNDAQTRLHSKQPTSSSSSSTDGGSFEISENFSFSKQEYEQTMAQLFATLPETGRLDGKPVEHFISALILKPLEVLDDDIHNRFTLMHNDMHALLKCAYDAPMESNEAELRALIELAFAKLHMYSHHIEQAFALRHSPRHYLMRQLRVDHRAVVFMAMRKLMYDKYPQWVASDNWATAEMSQENEKRFIICERLGLEHEHEDVDVDGDHDDDVDVDAMDDESQNGEPENDDKKHDNDTEKT